MGSFNMITKVSRTDCVKYFYMFMLFMWCAYTTPYLKPFDKTSLITSFIYVLVFVYYYIRCCVGRDQRPFVLIIAIFFFWYVAQCFKTKSITTIDFRLIYSIILCHISFFLYRKKEFFLYFEKVLFHLTLISLIVWFWGVVTPSFIRYIFDIISVWDNGYTTYGNFFFVALGKQESMGILRNIGFTWEAGRFSSFLVMGCFISLINHKMQIKKNRTFLFFFVGICSTVSTTGLVSLLGVMFLFLLNSSKSPKIITMILLLLLLPSLWGLDFVGGKILENINVDQGVIDMENSFARGTDVITPQRITGFFLEYQNWIHDFWFGYNLNENSFVQNIMFGGNEVWLSDGVLQIFSKYGVFIGIFMYYCLIKSSILLSKDFNYKGKYLLAITFILINFSYDFWSSGVFLHIVFYSIYNKECPDVI